MQEIAFLVKSNGDFKAADGIPRHERSPYMEVTDPSNGKTLADHLKTNPPHLWKTHLPAKFFEKTLKKSNTKIIVVMRNPKDTLVSNYFFYKANLLLGNFTGTWDEFFQLFQAQRLVYGDFFDHVLSWWEVRNNPNVKIIMYEDIVGKPIEVIKQVAAHMGKTLSDELIHKIADRVNFDNMKKKQTSNYSNTPGYRADISPFLRKGKVGDWQNHFSEEQSKIIDDLYEKRCVDKGLIFQF